MLAALALLVGAAAASSGTQPTGVVDANGTGLRVFTHDRVTETSPVWSPNHEQIAFLRPRKRTSDQVWVMNADGTNQHAVSHFSGAPQLYGNSATPDLTWSPDGQELVFSAFANSKAGVQQLFALSVRTHAVRRLTRLHVGATNPQWSPDGRWIAFVSGVAPGRIYLLSPRTHKAHAVGRATGLDIAWSPNGKQLVFHSRGKLETMTIDGTRYHSLGVWGAEPSWSPDGRWIVFTYGDYVKEIRPSGRGIRHILYVTSKKGENFEPNW